MLLFPFGNLSHTSILITLHYTVRQYLNNMGRQSDTSLTEARKLKHLMVGNVGIV